MGKLSYGMLVSLDGFVAGPNGDLSWHIVEEELHNFALERERDVPITLYGRRMYETMSYWGTPTAVMNRPRYERISRNSGRRSARSFSRPHCKRRWAIPPSTAESISTA
jgi:dihydrofolate reductase